MNAKFALLTLPAIAGIFAIGDGQHNPRSAGPAGDVGDMFKRQCASCHFAPDLRFRSDRAWLDQIKRTA